MVSFIKQAAIKKNLTYDKTNGGTIQNRSLVPDVQRSMGLKWRLSREASREASLVANCFFRL